jgi:hypothetical protein
VGGIRGGARAVWAMIRGDAGQTMLVMEATEETRADEFELFFRLLIPREYSILWNCSVPFHFNQTR